MLSFKDSKEVRRYCEKKNLEFISFYVSDIDGRLRNVTIPYENFTSKTINEGIGFDASNLGYAAIDNSDMILKPDLNFAFEDAVNENSKTLYFMTHILETNNKQNFDQDLRHMVNKAMTSLKNEGIADEAQIGLELEFYIFDELYSMRSALETSYRIVTGELANPHDGRDQYRVASNRGYHRSEPNDHYFQIRNDICSALKKIGLEVKYHHHEVGAAQAEIEFKFMPVELMADATSLAKSICHRVAAKHGKVITFLPKIIPGEAGNGMHVHHFLLKDGKNIFNDPNGLYKLSKTALYYIGGILKHASSLLAFTNPTTNSYRRLIPGFEAPVKAVFAESNRSAAIRIPGYIQDPEERRFEFRTIDATCNPHLAYAAMIMAGLDGIRKQIDPTAEGFGPFETNLYELPKEQLEKIKSFPRSLDRALQALKEDNDYLTYGDVFPMHLIDLWIKVKKRDIAEMQQVPHPWEVARYYDL
ncbi:type I glutamate--ammonia ligase [bacterium]|nr:type I glutamate--ammonia ligase [bacterium]